MGGKNDGLSAKQRAFAEAYIATGIKQQAALDAGYSEKYAKAKSYLLLENPKISAYIERRQRELLKKGTSPERLLQRLEIIANADVADYIEVVDGVVKIKDTQKIPKAKRAAIAGITEGPDGRISIKFHDSPKAIREIFRVTGVYGSPLLLDDTPDEKNPLKELSKEELYKLAGIE